VSVDEEWPAVRRADRHGQWLACVEIALSVRSQHRRAVREILFDDIEKRPVADPVHRRLEPVALDERLQERRRQAMVEHLCDAREEPQPECGILLEESRQDT
jgi:hypothetical protein